MQFGKNHTGNDCMFVCQADFPDKSYRPVLASVVFDHQGRVIDSYFGNSDATPSWRSNVPDGTRASFGYLPPPPQPPPHPQPQQPDSTVLSRITAINDRLKIFHKSMSKEEIAALNLQKRELKVRLDKEAEELLRNLTDEINYGKNPTNHPDWTFCAEGQGSCPQPSAFRLQIFVNTPITTSANLVTTSSVSVAANPIYRTATTISYTTTTPGRVTFLEAGRVITGCKNKLVTSATTCSWRPSRRNAVTVSARLTPANVALPVNTATTAVYILKRSTSR
jgi:hypothetical protein